MAPRKVRAVAALVKGMGANEAEAQLMFTRRRAAKPLLKLLRSGMAAVKAQGKMDMEKIAIQTITVDGGPMLKRYMARAQGRMAEIQKKMCHITLVLAENPKVKNSKFRIVVEKKVKHLEHEENPKKNPRKEVVEKSSKPKEAGFFKKVFQRNTGNKSSGNKSGA